MTEFELPPEPAHKRFARQTAKLVAELKAGPGSRTATLTERQRTFLARLLDGVEGDEADSIRLVFDLPFTNPQVSVLPLRTPLAVTHVRALTHWAYDLRSWLCTRKEPHACRLTELDAYRPRGSP